MITGFLKTKRPKEELKTALEVLRDFKKCESDAEWFSIPFMSWAKLEQLEEFLEHLVEGKPLKMDTRKYVEKMKQVDPTFMEPKPSMFSIRMHDDVTLTQILAERRKHGRE